MQRHKMEGIGAEVFPGELLLFLDEQIQPCSCSHDYFSTCTVKALWKSHRTPKALSMFPSHIKESREAVHSSSSVTEL